VIFHIQINRNYTKWLITQSEGVVMSANNAFIGKEHNGKWYGWDETAEADMNDAEDGYRLLNYDSAIVEADSREELYKQMDERSYLGYSEYGWDFSGHLPKDSLPIRFI
jgi:hypothetical protein